MSSINPLIIWSIVAYIVGSIPSGYLIARWYGIHDIRKTGSGNIGASNVGRSLGVFGFIIVFLLDAVKAYAFLFLAQHAQITSEFDLLVISFCILLGNCYSLFLNGQGGKGIATLVGISAAHNYYIALLFAASWLIGIVVTRVASLASMIALITVGCSLLYFNIISLFYFFAAATLIIIWRHKSNIIHMISARTRKNYNK